MRFSTVSTEFSSRVSVAEGFSLRVGTDRRQAIQRRFSRENPVGPIAEIKGATSAEYTGMQEGSR